MLQAAESARGAQQAQGRQGGVAGSAGAALQLGEQFVGALVARDFSRLAAGLHPEVRFRALTPNALQEAHDPEETTSYFQRWFGQADRFERLDSAVVGIANRVHLTWRFRLHDEDGWQVIEQQAYASVRGGRIVSLDLVCSGFMADDAAAAAGEVAGGEQADVAGFPRPDATLDAYGEDCATLTPLIRSRIKALESGQVLEVRSDDPAARDGIPAWSRLTGNQIVATADEGGDHLRFYLRRR